MNWLYEISCTMRSYVSNSAGLLKHCGAQPRRKLIVCLALVFLWRLELPVNKTVYELRVCDHLLTTSHARMTNGILGCWHSHSTGAAYIRRCWDHVRPTTNPDAETCELLPALCSLHSLDFGNESKLVTCWQCRKEQLEMLLFGWYDITGLFSFLLYCLKIIFSAFNRFYLFILLYSTGIEHDLH